MNTNAELDSDHVFKVLLLGDSGVGKSCLILRYTENQFSTTLMNSIGVDFKIKNVEFDGKIIKLQIWDTAGQERFRTITTSYYRGANAIAIVYDITDRESFDHVKNWIIDIEKFAKENVLRFLVGNKKDLEERRKVSEEEGRELAKCYNIPFLETSAKESINTNELFTLTMKTYLEKVTLVSRRTSEITRKPFVSSVTIDKDRFEDKNCDRESCCLK